MIEALGVTLIALIVYTYAGYPLLVALASRLLGRPAITVRAYEPLVSVGLAVHDGAEYLARKLTSLRELDYPREKIEFIVCSDGRNSETRRIVERFRSLDPRFVFIENETRRGKPASLNRIARAAQGDVLVWTDVRQTLSRNAVRALVAPLADPTIGCVSGNLVVSGNTGAVAYWRYERFIRGSEGRLGRMVGVSGAIYAIRRRDLPELPEDVILDDMFVPSSVTLHGQSVTLAEEARAYDQAFDDEREFSRKVRTLAGNYQLIAKLPGLLVPFVNKSWFEIVSHKLLRLICPFALIALFGVSIAVAVSSPASWFWRALVIAELAFYTLAVLGSAAGRIGALARTFVVLNAAALVGLWRFARGRQAITW